MRNVSRSKAVIFQKRFFIPAARATQIPRIDFAGFTTDDHYRLFHSKQAFQRRKQS